jgi:hypothetical protein
MIRLRDRLSHLTFQQACKLLGPEGGRLIRTGGKYEIDVTEQVSLTDDMFKLDLGEAAVTVTLNPAKKDCIHLHCNACTRACEHAGAALSLILEEKLTLGLSAPPRERVPVESLSDEELEKRAIEDRLEKAKAEKMTVRAIIGEELWTDYLVTSRLSGKTYRVALRGWGRGDSYCSCPDFRKNTLGTCKHMLHVIEKAEKRFSKKIKNTPYVAKEVCVHIQYGRELELRVLVPDHLDGQAKQLLRPVMNRPIEDVGDLLKRIRKVEATGHEVTIYPDAEEYMDKALYLERIRKKTEEIRKDPKNHPLRKTLLKAELLPYQLDGIAFAVGVGRAILADDMGLGKTIQGIGVAELLSMEAGISKVLVVCPASLKSQWRLEIMRFSDRSCQIVLGNAEERAAQYDNSCFFTVCNYEQVLRDIYAIETVKWDLIILDEGQRIKNWATKTSQTTKSLRSRFALVLSGTPLENRLDDLYSITEFVDDRRLGPAFRFFNRYRVIDDRGKVLGYKNLDEFRKRIGPVLLRRTRKNVMRQLPPRTTDLRRIPPTDEQLDIDLAQRRIIGTIVSKRYISEMDLLRLQKALLICRMAANSTFLVDKNPPGFSTKLEEIDILLNQLAAEDGRKIVLFSEWTTMLDLIEPYIEKQDLKYVRLDGSVPQKKRQELMHRFQKDPEHRLFITTNAGSTGLNLQAADTVINVDLPWNPAVLEQRISRVHRMGQKRPVHVFILVTEGTLEESLLETLSSKHELAAAALDPESKVSAVDLASGMEELKRRLEVLLGKKPDAPIDESRKDQVEAEAQQLLRRQKIADAGGQLLGAAFAFMGEVLAQKEKTEHTRQMAATFKNRLYECLEKDENNKLKMTVTLPDESVLDNLAESLAQILASR